MATAMALWLSACGELPTEGVVAEGASSDGHGRQRLSCGLRSDVDGDGYSDLVVGAPYEDVSSGTNQGAVSIIYGSASGLGNRNQLLHRDQPGVEDVAGDSDLFGMTVAVGDFNGDCRADVAVGVPFDDVSGVSNAGSVHIFYGTILGASTSTDVVLHQGNLGLTGDLEANDSFGSALAVGDFNGDGYADLAVGVPDEDIVSLTDTGVVDIIYGSASGLSSTGVQVWSQNTGSIQDLSESGDQFGFALGSGDFDGDGRDDLAIGVPDEDSGSISSSGAVHVLYGSSAGLDDLGNQFWQQGVGSVPGTTEAGDRFGFTLAAGDFDGDGHDDLAMGAPYENVSPTDDPLLDDGGWVHVLYGTATGLLTSGSQIWSHGSFGTGLKGDELFGRSLVSADFDGDGYDDLAAGSPKVDANSLTNSGLTAVLYGGTPGLSLTRSTRLVQHSTDGVCEAGDMFGHTLAAGDYDGNGYADLAIGVPYEDVGAVSNAGAVTIRYSSGSAGLSTLGEQFLTQGSDGLQDTAEAADSFGLGL